MGSRVRAVRRVPPWAFALALLAAACGPGGERGALHVVTIDRGIDAVAARYVDRAIGHAEDRAARAVLLRVDTPGGESGAMRTIVGRIERAGTPVVAWVGPPGAAAASAGTFVAMAAHVAAMAPSTTIGAATPVTAAGEDIEGALGRKVTNDAVAFARGVADLRGRNADWAEDAVREARSATPDEAVALNVVDLVAATEEQLIGLVEGREVELIDGRAVVLRLAGAPRVENGLNGWERVLVIVSDPLVVTLLLLAGVAGLAAELFIAPGSFVAGVAGAIALLLAFLGIGTLVPAEAALALAALAIALFVLELFVPTGGVLGAGAAVALAVAIVIAVGQGSTDLGAVRVLAILLGAVGAAGLLLAAILGFFAARYWAASAPPEAGGGRL